MRLREDSDKLTVLMIAIVGVTFILSRLILDSRFSHSAAFYVAIPFTVSMLISLATKPTTRKGNLGDYLRHMRLATIVMLGTSAFLFEGFICVLFIMPIYYIMISISFTFMWALEKSNRNRNKLNASVIPLIVAVMAVEGLSPSTSFERQNSVTQTMVIDAPIAQLKANMARPMDLPNQRPLYLSVFPLPVETKAGSLQAGDIHALTFVYKRWFITNIDTGEFHLRIDEVGDRHVKTSVVKNTSYFAKYLAIEGTYVAFTELSDGRTEVALTVHYDRLLDPAWYFGPLQNLAVNQSADYLIENIICREICDG